MTDWTDYQYSGDGKMSDGELNTVLAQREQQLAKFQDYQRGPKQIAESTKTPSALGKEFYKEGFWANPEQEHTHHLPYPQQGPNWMGKDKFLSYLHAVQVELAKHMIRYKQGETCLLCGQEKLGDREFVDQNNKVIWKEGYGHYIQVHNVVPTKFFFNYIQQAGQVVGKKSVGLKVNSALPPSPGMIAAPPPPKPEQTLATVANLTPLERIQHNQYMEQPAQGPAQGAQRRMAASPLPQLPPPQQQPQYQQPQQPPQQPQYQQPPQQPQYQQPQYQQPQYQPQQPQQPNVPNYMQPRN